MNNIRKGKTPGKDKSNNTKAMILEEGNLRRTTTLKNIIIGKGIPTHKTLDTTVTGRKTIMKSHIQG